MRLALVLVALAVIRETQAADLVEPVVVRSVGGALSETIAVRAYEYAASAPSAIAFKTRGYFGSSETASAGATLGSLKIGPTLRFSAGDVVRVTVVNELGANADSAVMNTFHTPNTTNLHVHGLHVSSYDPMDNVMVKIEPGENRTYEYDVIGDHAAGTHWYHAHSHGSTAIQTGGGMVGVIVVEDAVDEIPSSLASVDEKILFVQYMQFGDIVNIAGRASMSEAWTSTSTGTPAGTAHFTVNGQYAPTIKIDQNEWTRLRIVFSSLNKVVKFQLSSAAAGLGCEWKLLAKDGIYVQNAPRALSSVYLAPGNRVDILIRCSSVGTFEVDSVAVTGPSFVGAVAGALNFQVVASSSILTSINTFTAKRPNYLATITSYGGSGPTETHDFRFQGQGPPVGRRRLLQGGPQGPQGPGVCTISYDNAAQTLYTGSSLGSVAAGTVQTWRLGGSNTHPFHVHVNSFQLGAVTDTTSDANPYFVLGDWHDVNYQPPGVTIQTIYWHAADFAGKVVTHCHFLDHEDQGCMAFFEIVGANGTVVSDLVGSALVDGPSPPPSVSPPAANPPSSSAAFEGSFSLLLLIAVASFV